MIAPLPPNEAERLAALRELAILDTPYEEAYDRITRLATRLFKVPTALISLVDERRQWFKSCQGFPNRETGRELSFCAHTILNETVLVVPDAKRDRRFADNSLVTESPGIRFYAGAPLKSSTGYNVGTLCIIDTTPREFPAAEQEVLEDLAAVVADEFELRTSCVVRKQLVEHLEDTLEKLTKAEAMRDSLLQMVVHDLRNPVVGMMGLLELVLEQARSRLTEDEFRYLTVSKDSADSLNEMITSLLDVDRLEAGQMPLEFHEGDLREIVASATETTKANPANRISLDLPAEAVIAECDRNIVCRVVANLVGNAVKHAPAGSPIHVAVTTEGGDALVAVSDQGPGVPAEYQEKIFDRFGQIEGARHTHSTGLGLTFCKLAVEAHGGDIRVESEAGGGSTFSFRLPRRSRQP